MLEPHDEPGDYFIILTPNEEFDGHRMHVRFYKGEGKTDNFWVARDLEQLFGYEVYPPASLSGIELPLAAEKSDDSGKPLFPVTVADLLKMRAPAEGPKVKEKVAA